MKGALLVCGTHSDAGKSVLVAGICRWLRRQGTSVAPFKAQNMALNSVVTIDGAEVGRAQAVQASAAGVELEAAMNPVLIKPSGERHSQVIVMGRPYADADARSYAAMKHDLRPVVARALADLRERFDVVVCEGAGSPAEVNLRAHDLTNMWLARHAHLPTLVVADIDRGGVFASLFGTLALLAPQDQALISGFVINKFRGDDAILAPGLEQLTGRTGRPTLGVLPFVEDLWMDVEDSLALDASRPEMPAAGGDTLEVAVLRLRWMSNFTDADALSAEPGVRVRFTRSAADIERADLVVVPGTKATVEDLERLRAAGLHRALAARAAGGGPILGICGGYQMLGRRIEDDVESRRGGVDGLGLLPVTTRFAADKVLRRRTGRSPLLRTGAAGYEVRHGRVDADGPPILIGDDGEPDGCAAGSTLGTSWHGVLEHDGFRRALLEHVATRRGRRFVPGTTPFAEARGARLDALGDLVEHHLDTRALTALITGGPPAALPILETEVRACCAS
ncbi:MAG TPA: cobyric acid synthase [Solirubrobacteraceae bacterium]|nr:cobyric acid synthase [Solirubrobacteraceae bacterium]